MKIKDRIALQFTLLVAGVLLVFSIAIYSVSEHYRQEEFYDRLRGRARTTCRLLVKVKGIDKDLLKAIDQNTLSEMLDEKVLIFDSKTSADSVARHIFGSEMCAAGVAALIFGSEMCAAGAAVLLFDSEIRAAGVAALTFDSKTCAVSGRVLAPIP